jgi:DNA-binding NtrC family response regulator
VLIVDDQETVCIPLRDVLRDRGYAATYCLSGPAALEELDRTPYAVLVADMVMPGMDGLALLREVRTRFPEVPVVIMTAHGTIETAVEAIQLGASDFVQKPFLLDQFCLVIERVSRQRRLLDELAHLRDELGERYQFHHLISRDPAMREIFTTIARVAATDATVLITGETGTGKELVARAIHYNSPRREARFTAVNCGALPDTLLESELFGHEQGAFTGAITTKPGIFEVTDGGTLLLDEIGNVTPAMQTKLLRTLETMEFKRLGSVESRHCNVRILASTHVDLREAVTRGTFRGDLFYRINVVPVHLPPLRERPADIPLLVDHFVQLHGPKLNPRVLRFAPDALRQLARCSWPGNVRELEHVVQRALILAPAPIIRVEDLPPCAEHRPEEEAPIPCNEYLPLAEVKERFLQRLERIYLDKVLRLHHGNVRQTAKHAGFSERSIHTKIKRYGLDRRSYK